MHPADQFETFKKLAEERGFGVEEIAARFGTTSHVVLRLGAASPKPMRIIAMAICPLNIIETVLGERNCKPESSFDLVRGITAFARGKAHQDTRADLEGKAKRLTERTA